MTCDRDPPRARLSGTECEPPRRDRPVAHGETYGGVSILRALARLFEWRDLTFEQDGHVFIVSWRVPVSERGAAGQAD